MSRLLAVVLALAILLVPLRVHGQVQDIPPGDDKIVPLRLNEPAPFAGHLYSPETALRWANWLQQYQLRLELEQDTQKRVCQAELAFQDEKAQLKEEEYLRVRQDLSTRLSLSEAARKKAEYELAHPSWYNTRGFNIGLGVFLSLSLVGLAAVIVR